MFVKKYGNWAEAIANAMEAYIKDVKDAAFPTDDHGCHYMSRSEETRVELAINRFRNSRFFSLVGHTLGSAKPDGHGIVAIRTFQSEFVG